MSRHLRFWFTKLFLLLLCAWLSLAPLATSAAQNERSEIAEIEDLSAFAEEVTDTVEHTVQEPPQQVVLDSTLAADHLAQQQFQQYKPNFKLDHFLPPEIKKIKDSPLLTQAYEEYKNTGALTENTTNSLLSAIVEVKQENTQKPHALRRFWDNIRFTGLSPLQRHFRIEDEARWSRETRLNYLQSYLPARIVSAFSEFKTYEEDPRQAVTAIKVYHVGGENSDTLKALLGHYGHAGFTVIDENVSTTDLQKNLEELQKQTNLALTSLTTDAPSQPQEQRQWRSWSNRFKTALRSVVSRVKHSLGIASGVNFVQFKLAHHLRAPRERYIELGAAAATATGVSWAVFKTVEQKRMAGELVNTWLPLGVTIGDKLFFGYFQRSVSAFFGQGLSYSFKQHKFKMNKMFFLLAVYLNSLVLREALTMATHTPISLNSWTIDFAMTWTLLFGAAGSSLRGLFSKAPLQIFIEKLRKNLAHHPWLTIAILTGWNTLWGAGQVADVYNLHTTLPTPLGPMQIGFRSIMGVLAGIGAVIEVRRDPEFLERWYQRLRRFMAGVPQEQCRAVLTYELKADP